MIDLHTHTTASDGTDSPTQLINKAHAQGLTAIAITDHDTTSGWIEAERALRPGLALVKGAEISAQTHDGISVHMLGLLFDGDEPHLKQMLEETRDQRLPRMRKMIERLNAAGIDISMSEVEEATPLGATLGRPHLADALVAKKIIKSRDEAFAELLHNDSPYYVGHLSPTPEDTIRAIRSAGGVAVIAHPFASHRGKVINAATFQSLVDSGLCGIEVDHRDHSNDERSQLVDIAIELGLVMTGSSDYHGTGKLNGLGENTTNPAQWEKLESMADARRVVRK